MLDKQLQKMLQEKTMYPFYMYVNLEKKYKKLEFKCIICRKYVKLVKMKHY